MDLPHHKSGSCGQSWRNCVLKLNKSNLEKITQISGEGNEKTRLWEFVFNRQNRQWENKEQKNLWTAYVTICKHRCLLQKYWSIHKIQHSGNPWSSTSPGRWWWWQVTCPHSIYTLYHQVYTFFYIFLEISSSTHLIKLRNKFVIIL